MNNDTYGRHHWGIASIAFWQSVYSRTVVTGYARHRPHADCMFRTIGVCGYQPRMTRGRWFNARGSEIRSSRPDLLATMSGSDPRDELAKIGVRE